jgi:hypothetical protein
MNPVVGRRIHGGVCSASLTRFVFALRRAFSEISVEDPQPRSTCSSYFSSIVDCHLVPRDEGWEVELDITKEKGEGCELKSSHGRTLQLQPRSG